MEGLVPGGKAKGLHSMVLRLLPSESWSSKVDCAYIWCLSIRMKWEGPWTLSQAECIESIVPVFLWGAQLGSIFMNDGMTHWASGIRDWSWLSEGPRGEKRVNGAGAEYFSQGLSPVVNGGRWVEAGKSIQLRGWHFVPFWVWAVQVGLLPWCYHVCLLWCVMLN